MKHKNFHCSQTDCHFSFDCKPTMKRHEKKYHSKTAEYFFCRNCDYFTPDSSNLASHRKKCLYLKQSFYKPSLSVNCLFCGDKPEVLLFSLESSKLHRKKCEEDECHLCQRNDKAIHLWEHLNECPFAIDLVEAHTNNLKMNKVNIDNINSYQY